MAVKALVGILAATSLANNAWAQSADVINMQAAYDAVRSRCDVQESVVRQAASSAMPAFQTRIVRKDWTGACVNGFLDGEGTITIEASANSGHAFLDGPSIEKSTGLMVKGKPIGPWRIEASRALISVGAYRWEDFAVPGHYTKQADGAFQKVEVSNAPDEDGKNVLSLVPIAAIAPIPSADVERYLGGAQASGKPARIAIQSPLVRDLLRGGKMRVAPSRSLGVTRNQRLLIVLSSNAIATFDRIDEFRKIATEFVVTEANPSVRAAATRLATIIDKKTLIEGLARQLREYFAKVSVADDLSSFRKSDADLVLVFDFTFEHKLGDMLKQRQAESSLTSFGLLGARATPAPAMFVGASHLLLNNELELVRASFSLPQRLTMRPDIEGIYNDAEPAKARDARMVDGLNALAGGLQKAMGADAFGKIADAQAWACKSVVCPLLLDLRTDPEQPQH